MSSTDLTDLANQGTNALLIIGGLNWAVTAASSLGDDVPTVVSDAIALTGLAAKSLETVQVIVYSLVGFSAMFQLYGRVRGNSSS